MSGKSAIGDSAASAEGPSASLAGSLSVPCSAQASGFSTALSGISSSSEGGALVLCA
ncbi:hypothetical protein [Qipengyuania flava]|uniref:hypothetical protein n=1 Tax=Qipengyuania flava TaxID=192812 RepID=UPI00215A88E7|nr:hypothetical protein [Qipengyuania flava]